MRGRTHTHTRTYAHTQVTPPKMQRKAFVIRTQLLEPLSHLSPPGLVRYAGAVKNGSYTPVVHTTAGSLGIHRWRANSNFSLVLFNNKNCIANIEKLDSRTVKLYMWYVWNKGEMYTNYFILGVFRNNRSSKSSFHQVLRIKSPKYVPFVRVCSMFLSLG